MMKKYKAKMRTDEGSWLETRFYCMAAMTVIKAYDQWVKFADNNQKPGSDEGVTLFGKLMLRIRQDIVGKTKVTVHEISNLNPFNRG